MNQNENGQLPEAIDRFTIYSSLSLRLFAVFSLFRHAADDTVSTRKSQFASLAQIGNSMCGVAQGEGCEATIKISFGQLRIAAYRSIVVRDGSAKVAASTAEVAAVEVGESKIWCEANDDVVVANDEFVVAKPRLVCRKSFLSRRRGEFVLPRTCGLQLLIAHNGARELGQGVVWGELNGAIQVADGLGEILHKHVIHRAAEV